MRTLIMLALTGITFAQTPAAPKKEEKAVQLDKDKVISFLKAQRDIQTVQAHYDQAFKAEPAVVAFTSKLQEMQKLCSPGVFDPAEVTCKEAPPETPATANKK